MIEMPRPYIQKTGLELAALFEQSKEDADSLSKLLSELQHRSTPTAKRLRKQVETTLEGLRGAGAAGKQKQSHEEDSKTASKGPESRLLKCKACATNLRIPVQTGRASYTCPKCGIVFETRLEDGLFEVVFLLDDESSASRSSNQQMTIERACEVLGLTWPTTEDEVKKAWRKLCQQYHPDKHQELPERLKRAADDEAKLINIAYRFLETRVEQDSH